MYLLYYASCYQGWCSSQYRACWGWAGYMSNWLGFAGLLASSWFRAEARMNEKVMEMPKVQPALVLAVADELLLLHICVRHATQMRWVLVSCIVLWQLFHAHHWYLVEAGAATPTSPAAAPADDPRACLKCFCPWNFVCVLLTVTSCQVTASAKSKSKASSSRRPEDHLAVFNKQKNWQTFACVWGDSGGPCEKWWWCEGWVVFWLALLIVLMCPIVCRRKEGENGVTSTVKRRRAVVAEACYNVKYWDWISEKSDKDDDEKKEKKRKKKKEAC